MKRTYAKIAKHLIETEDYPIASILITSEEWERLKFICMTLDSQDSIPFLETDHPDRFNMILLHPEKHELFWAYSCDFDYITE